MKKLMVLILLVLALAVGFAVVRGGQTQVEENIGTYTKALADTTFFGHDENETARHGTALYDYELSLRADGTCRLLFTFGKYDDDSLFSTNKTESFAVEASTWSVVHTDGTYFVCLDGGAWDWGEYSAAELSRQFAIGDEAASTLRCVRSQYYDVILEREGM